MLLTPDEVIHAIALELSVYLLSQPLTLFPFQASCVLHLSVM